MTTWVLKDSAFSWPHDLICVQMDDERLLFIQENGACDVEHVSMGMPTESKWWRFDCEPG